VQKSKKDLELVLENYLMPNQSQDVCYNAAFTRPFGALLGCKKKQRKK